MAYYRRNVAYLEKPRHLAWVRIVMSIYSIVTLVCYWLPFVLVLLPYVIMPRVQTASVQTVLRGTPALPPGLTNLTVRCDDDPSSYFLRLQDSVKDCFACNLENHGSCFGFSVTSGIMAYVVHDNMTYMYNRTDDLGSQSLFDAIISQCQRHDLRFDGARATVVVQPDIVWWIVAGLMCSLFMPLLACAVIHFVFRRVRMCRHPVFMHIVEHYAFGGVFAPVLWIIVEIIALIRKSKLRRQRELFENDKVELFDIKELRVMYEYHRHAFFYHGGFSDTSDGGDMMNRLPDDLKYFLQTSFQVHVESSLVYFKKRELRERENACADARAYIIFGMGSFYEDGRTIYMEWVYDVKTHNIKLISADGARCIREWTSWRQALMDLLRADCHMRDVANGHDTVLIEYKLKK